MELGELPRGAPARDRRERDQPPGRSADVLAPRPHLQRPLRAGHRDGLDAAGRPHRPASDLSGAGLLDVRAGRVPRRRGNLVRRSAGHRRGRAPPRRPAGADGRPGDGDRDADRRRRERRHRLHDLPAQPRPLQRLGRPRRHCGRVARALGEDPAARLAGAERRRGRPRAHGRPAEKATIRATVDYWDDQSDVYRIRLFPGQHLFASLATRAGRTTAALASGHEVARGSDPDLANKRVGRSAKRGSEPAARLQRPRGPRRLLLPPGQAGGAEDGAGLRPSPS